MELSRDTWAIYSALTRKTDIDPEPQYQRTPVWSVAQKQLFIDSIFRGYDIPKLYLRKVDGSHYEYEVLDGQQRLRAIWEFSENKFPVGDESDPVKGHAIAGEVFDDIHATAKDQFHGYQLQVVIIKDILGDDIEDMFLRLNNGVPLNSAEKRNAISGQLRDFVHDTATNHKLMKVSVNFKNNRYAFDEAVAQMLLVEMNGGPTRVRHTQLKTMYEGHKTFKLSSQEAKKLNRVMNFLARAFPTRSPYLTKVNLLSLYTVASGMISRYNLQNRAQEFGSWFLDFEERRKADEELSEDVRDDRMVSYSRAIQQQSADPASQRTRQEFLTEDILAAIPDLLLLDDQRVFTTEQRATIFHRDGKKCNNPNNNPECAIDCEWDNWHADHIIPHSQGGRTTVSNGQLLCPSCNHKKNDQTD